MTLLLNQTWEVVARLPKGLAKYMQLVWIEGWGVLSLGGTIQGKPTDDVHLFDLRNNTWQKKASFVDRVKTASCVAVVFRGERSVFCARGGGAVKSTFIVAAYSLTNNSWTRLADKSDNFVANSGAFPWDGRVYFLGDVVEKGKTRSFVETVEYFDLAAERWVGNLSEPSLPDGNFFCADKKIL